MKFAVVAAALLAAVGCGEDREPSLSAFCTTFDRVDSVLVGDFEDVNPQAARTLAAEMRRYAPDEVFEDVVVFTDMLGELFDLFEEHGQAVAAGDLDAADELRGQIHERVEAAAVEIDVEFDRMTRYVWAAC